MYITDYTYFYFPYIAFAQCACVGDSTLFSVINEIPSRINFGANEAVFTHNFTNTWKIFAFVRANTDSTYNFTLNYVRWKKIHANKKNFAYHFCHLEKIFSFRKCIKILDSRLALAINATEKYFRSILAIRASEDEISHDSLFCENLR